MRSLKALSPIVAVVMLILIAIAASVLVYVWMSGLVASTPTTEPTLEERIKIEGVSVSDQDTTWGNGNETVVIYVKNVGKIRVENATGYVINSIDDSMVCQKEAYLTASLGVGTVRTITLENCTIAIGVPYIAKVVTTKGTEATYTFIVEQ